MKQKLLILLFVALGLGKGTLCQRTTAGPISINTDSLKKQAELVKKSNKELASKTNYKYFIIKAQGGTYGYSIFANGQQYIWQTTIPAMPGNKGFTTIDAAEKTAQLVIQKIKEGEMPPTITADDLRKFKII